MNDVITHMIDPNLYFSRFSFLESGMEAINIKQEVSIRFPKSYLFSNQRSRLYRSSATNSSPVAPLFSNWYRILLKGALG